MGKTLDEIKDALPADRREAIEQRTADIIDKIERQEARLAEAERLLRVVIGKWPDPVVDMHAKEIVAFLTDRETE